jgi:hypothetical protein
MKKLALATAVATATITSGAYAGIVSSNITGIELWSVPAPPGTPVNIEVGCGAPLKAGFTTGLSLLGVKDPTVPVESVILKGEVCLDPTGAGLFPYVALSFDLAGGEVAGGTVFNSGTIDIYTDLGSGWLYAYPVTVGSATTPTIDCTTANGKSGLQWTATPGANTLPGFATPPTTDAVCEANLLGTPATLLLSGTNSW